MLKLKNVGRLIKRNTKIISSYERLSARTVPASHISQGARYAHNYESAPNFIRPASSKKYM